MELNNYQNLSERTLPEGSLKDKTTNYALGLTGESGEVADCIKKWAFHGHILNLEELSKELGDVLHYISGLATFHGLELEDIAEANINKLKKRYPNGFSKKDSIKRED